MDRVKIAEKLSTKIRGSSIIEVITALLIISIVFTLATTIYLNVQKTGFFLREFVCNVRIDEMYTETLQKKDFVAKEAIYEDITIYQDVKRSSLADHLLEIRFEARDENGKLLVEKKYLIYDTKKP